MLLGSSSKIMSVKPNIKKGGKISGIRGWLHRAKYMGFVRTCYES